MSTVLRPFSRITFGLPAQEFKISAYISMQERLPAVTEFVLRLLHICERVSLSGFRAYFGFTEAEGLAVVESLDRQGYITLSGDMIELSEQTKSKFAESADDYPWVQKTKKWIGRASFDLLEFAPLSRLDEALSPDSWVKINPPAELLGNSIEYAKRAFHQHYKEIERRSRGDRVSDRERDFGVHSIEAVDAGKQIFIPISVTLAVDESGQAKTVLPEPFEEGSKPSLLQTTLERIAAEFDRLPEADSRGVVSFVEMFELDFMRQFITGRSFNFSAFATAVSGGLGAPAGVTPIFGNLSLQSNVPVLEGKLKELRGKNHARKLYSSLAWLPPEYEFWGRGDDFRDAVRKIRNGLRASGSDDNLFVFRSAEPGQEQRVRAGFRGTGLEELHLFRPRVLEAAPWADSLELMLYPCGFVAALIHLQIPGARGMLAPVGFFSTRAEHMETVHRLITSKVSGQRYAGRWSPVRTSDPAFDRRRGTFEELCGFMQYEPLPGRATSR
jgi:hypothetical protein